MKCAYCRGDLKPDESKCLACGRSVRADEAPGGEVRIVEGTIAPPLPRISYMPARVAPPERRALVPAISRHPALVAAARLPALVWRQPVVRSVVTTSASAIALTVALRLAGRIVASRGARDLARESLLPVLAELIAPAQRESRAQRRGRQGEVSEVFIYMRRSVRL